MTGCSFSRYEQSETSPETIEQEFATCSLLTATDRLKKNYSIDEAFNEGMCCSLMNYYLVHTWSSSRFTIGARLDVVSLSENLKGSGHRPRPLVACGRLCQGSTTLCV